MAEYTGFWEHANWHPKKGEKTMTLKRRYINEVYGGDFAAYRRDRRDDYCKAQFQWQCWIDALCKSGEITQDQYNRATF